MLKKLRLWRSWVSWQRSLLFKISKGEKVNWLQAIQQLLEFINKALTLVGFPKLPTPNPNPLPEEPESPPNDAEPPSPSPEEPPSDNPYDVLTGRGEIPMPGRAKPREK
jgi:hypothetical protein